MIYLYVTLFLLCIKVGKVILKPEGKKKKGKKEYNAQNQKEITKHNNAKTTLFFSTNYALTQNYKCLLEKQSHWLDLGP